MFRARARKISGLHYPECSQNHQGWCAQRNDQDSGQHDRDSGLDPGSGVAVARVVQCGHRMRAVALLDQLAGEGLAAAAAGAHTKLELDVVKPQPDAGAAGDFPI